MKRRVQFLLWVGGVSMVLNTVLFYAIETGENPAIDNPGDALWWWLVTSTTVGCGDIVPSTGLGRWVAGLTIVTGFYLYTNAVAIIAESVHSFLDRHERGRAQVTASGHIVICEYTAMADELIQDLPNVPELSDYEVAIISDLVKRNPYPQHHFVSGVPINPAALKRANVEQAGIVFVFANIRFADPDVKTLHVASRVKALNPKVPIIVEMVDPKSDLLRHAPSNLIVLPSQEVMGYVLQDKPFNPMKWIWASVRERGKAPDVVSWDPSI